MQMNTRDEVVETRTWSSGVEIVARINWSHIARVRSALGLAGDEITRVQFVRSNKRPLLTLHGDKTLRAAGSRAA